MNVRVIAAVVFALVGSACGRPTDEPMRPDQVLDANALYSENCAGCHGADGRHGVAQPLNDPVYLALISDVRIEDVVSRGVRGTPMAAFAKEAGGTLSKEQVRSLVAGIRKQWGSSSPLAGVSLPPYGAHEAVKRGSALGDAGRGRAAYSTYCARCHGEQGQGGPSGGSIVDPSFLELTSDQALRTTVIVGRADDRSPDWRGYVPGRPMSHQEISDVVEWLASQRGLHD
jgi:mono/diheme cytochrome c family protein